MATSMPPTGLPGIARVKDPDNYLNEMFETTTDPSIPTFRQFMTDVRGVPFEIFNDESKQLLALIMETTVYSQYCAFIKQQQQANDAASNDTERVNNWVDSVPTEDIDNAIGALTSRIEQLREARKHKVEANASA